MRRKVIQFVVLFACTLMPSCGDRSPAPKPNIVYILADDLGYGDLGCMGSDKIRTPNIDEMASGGMIFTQHYCGTAVCAPSRSSLMTGQHTGHTPIRANKEIRPEGQEPLPAEAYTIPEMLKAEGYVTGVFGKWGLGYPGSEGDPGNQGVDEFYGFNCQRFAHHYYPDFLRHNKEKIILEGNAGGKQNQFAPDVIHEQSLRFMEENHDHPFFMLVSSIIPHAELFAENDELRESYLGKFPEKSYRGAEYGEKGFRTGRYGSVETPYANYAAMISTLDKHVGEIIGMLEELGIAENTLVIFSSDNGPHFEGGGNPDFFNSTGGLRGYKSDLFEGGIRVPMIAYWPSQIPEGSRTDHLSAFWDVMPTIAEIAGIEPPKNIDGISLLPTLLGEEGQKEHEYLYWEFHGIGGKQAVRMGDWKLLRGQLPWSYWKRPREIPLPKEPVQDVMLFNIRMDPCETTDLSSQYPEKAEAMLEIMKEAHTPSEVFPGLIQ